MRYKTIITEVDHDGTAHIRLNRPETRNALSAQMIDDLTHCAQEFDASLDLRCVVLSGIGKTFCAGGDLAWMKAQIAADATTRRQGARSLAYMLRALNNMSKPLIGIVHGAALGGGVGMASVCDVVLADPACKFGFTETRLGLIPATIGPYVIARMGAARAREVFYSARIFGTEEAMRLGIVSRIVSSDDQEAEIKRETLPYLATGQFAVAQAKALAHQLGGGVTDEMIEQSIDALVRVWEGPEARHGIEAFFEKRKAPWDRNLQ